MQAVSMMQLMFFRYLVTIAKKSCNLIGKQTTRLPQTTACAARLLPTRFINTLICAFSVISLSACTTIQQNPTITTPSANAYALLPSAGFNYLDDKDCFSKSADWGTYCLKVIGEQELATPAGKVKLFQLGGGPLLARQLGAPETLPYAITLVGFTEIASHLWQLQNHDPRLYTVTAPVKIGVPKFTDFGGAHYGFIQRLFFVDRHNIYREKALISYLNDHSSQYLSTATALNDAHANVFKDTSCRQGNKRYQSIDCCERITVVGSTIGFKPSAKVHNGFRTITVDCRGTHLGKPADCAYELVYQAQQKRYVADRLVTIFGNSVVD